MGHINDEIIPDCPEYELIEHEEMFGDFKKFENTIITQIRLNKSLYNQTFNNVYEWNDIKVTITQKPQITWLEYLLKIKKYLIK